MLIKVQWTSQGEACVKESDVVFSRFCGGHGAGAVLVCERDPRRLGHTGRGVGEPITPTHRPENLGTHPTAHSLAHTLHTQHRPRHEAGSGNSPIRPSEAQWGRRHGDRMMQ
jgi:hypothetical protein